MESSSKVKPFSHNLKQHERIRGNRVSELMQRLLTERTLVQFQIPEISLNGLTLIRKIRKEWTKHYFLIDVPDGLWAAVKEPKRIDAIFEFTGPDRLKHRFRSRSGKSIRGDLWLRFPEFIERIQLRENFRLETRVKVRMSFQKGGDSHVLAVVNLSEGGVLAAGHTAGKAAPAAGKLKAGNELRDILLTIPIEGRRHTVTIDRAVVIRVTENPATDDRYYGMQFTQIERDEKNNLVRMIYQMQQDFLRKRLPGV